MQQRLLSAWYEGRWWLFLLLPLAWLLTLLALLRKRVQVRDLQPLSVPVIVVGNIAIGGTGKTPLIVAIVKHLQARGFRPGVISRGYGATAPYYPYDVFPDSDPRHSGDEPLLIAMATACPVVVGSDRLNSARQLIDKYRCNVILSDDGLQHYKLPRQFEICVVDGQRQMGNGFCLPAGPLREPQSRLNSVDSIVVNGEQPLVLSGYEFHSMQLKPKIWGNVADVECQSTLDAFFDGDLASQPKVQAVTGIGNPQRFFKTLSNLGVVAETKIFPDHHPFTASDLNYAKGQLLLMTQKDAVKCRQFADPNWWYLTVASELDSGFWEKLDIFMEKHHER